MPPKKRQKVTIQQEYIDSLPDSQSSSVTDPTLISQDQLARAYGLAPPRKNATLQTIDLLTGCSPKWKEGTSVTSNKMKTDKEVIELNDTSEDEISMQSTSDKGKKVVKGKGKAKQQGAGDDFKPRLCSNENCKDTPKCLNWLGQDKWENSAKAWKDYRKSMGLPPDPENERVPDIPVGLRNLGATCYVNSFLQVWYRDTRFRAGVYSCEPPANGNVESSPLFQLQVLFSFLQTSSQAIYDPTPLVNSLKLDQTEQQDAQEFSKLFLSLLDHEFKKQSLRKEQEGAGINVGKLVQEQFEGKMIYGTRCKTCRHASERPASFLELEVSLIKDCKLEDRIRQSLQDEQLTGDNKYHCEQCDGKRDATRYSELQSLPPVLHFSLLRFTFNLKDFSRSKSQNAISYPLSLDMGKYLPANPQTGQKDEVWYDLKGVLMHKGLSAHHGHYVAQVYDEQQSKWFLFDDESVEPVEDLNAPLIYDEDDDPVLGGKKKPVKKKVAVGAKGKGFVRDENGQVLPKSKDAYMLVYTRRPDPSRPKPAEPNPPPLARFEVDKIDDVYTKEVEDWNQTSGNAKEAFEKLREQKRSVYNSWDVTEEDEDAFLVDKASLKRWVESGLKATTNSKTDIKGKGKATEEDMEDVQIIEAPSNGARRNGDVEMNEASGSKSTSPSASTSRKESPSVSTSGPPLSPRKEDSLTPPPSTSDEEKKEKPKIELVKVISNAGIVCPHGHANPLRATQMKRVSQTACMTLQELEVDIEPKLVTTRDLCRECAAGMANECYYSDWHKTLVGKVKARDNPNNGETCQISKAWITDWLKNPPKMHSTVTGTDPSPASHPFIDDVLCEHGGLAADVKKRKMISLEAAKILQGEFPDFVIQDPRPCHVCEGTLEMDTAQLNELKEVQAKEKKLIKSFDMSQTRLGGARLPIGNDAQSHFVVPKDWTRQWASWVKAKTPGPRPPNLSNSSFLCKHSLLCLDLPKEVETAKTITIATTDEWKYLKKAYDAGPEIRVWIEEGETKPKSSPSVCKECLDVKRKNFVTTDVWIKVLQDSDLDEQGQRLFVDTSPKPNRSSPQASTSIKTASGTSVTNFYGSGQKGTRASARQRGTTLFKKELKHIEIEKSDKVKDLKPKIEEATGIASISQRIFFNLQELEGSQSVEELSIIGDDTLEVYEVKQDEDIDLDDLQDVDISKTRSGTNGKKRVREEGFGGTGLFGWDTGENSGGRGGDGVEEVEDEGNVSKRSKRSSKSTEQGAMEVEPIANGNWQEQDEATIPCPECTFLNNNALTECEICTAPLAG